MTKQAKFSREYAFELLVIAKQDLESAEFLAQHPGARVENIFLLAQQSLEKALKAVICWEDQPIPFLHDIGVLVAKIEALGKVPPFGFDLNGLSEFATIRRYLEGKETWSTDEIRGVLSEVMKAYQWCYSEVNPSKA